MYLKQLDVLGFKSFANKVSVHFSNGVTAIVGPNGCGKTNILDAVRWVLGEQKVSLLRGSKMEEVIFNGTRDVKPLGMAEVTMLLENNRGTLPTEYHEVQITRRLFRSGESEYLLNKVPCRLKDIAELFYDTGMGAHSYSVIQQEMIDAVISDRAEERRFLFEEAAGITKYKQRKKAALRKLEATDNDFLRLNDIYAEVKSQVLSLKRQHRKAERYQAIADDIRAWELFLSSQRRRTIESEQHDLRARLQAQSDRRLEHVAAVDRLAAQVESDRKEQVGLDAELVSVGGQVYQLSEQAHSDEREISVLAEKRANARGLIERNESEIEVLQARRGALHEQSAASERDLEQCRHDLDQVALGLREAEAELADADQRLLAARSAKELEGRSLIDLEGKLSSGRTETEGLRQQEEELTRLRTELEQQISEKTAARERLQAEAEAARQAVTEISERKAAAESSCQTLNTRIEQLLAQAENLTLEVSNLTASIEACEARRKLLEDMIVHYEGYESGVIAAMDERDRFGGGLVGTVAEKFVPAEGYEAVVDAALGEMAGFVICRDRDTAEAVIACVKSEKTGKIGILVPDSGTLNPVIKRPDLQLPEFVGWLDEFVTTEPELRPLLEAVLAWTAVFKSEYSPQPLLELLPYGFKAVSTAGVVYGKNVIAGGSDDRFPLFRRQEKVTQQQQMIDELGERLASAKHQKSMVTADIAAARAESATLTQTLESLAEELQTQQTKLNELEFQCRSLDGDLERLRRERQSSQAKLDKIRSRQYSLGLDVSQISSQREDLTQRMSRLGDSLANAEEAATRCLERVSQLQVAAVEARSKVEQSETKLTHLRELSDELNRTIAAKQEEISVALREIGDADRTISETEERLKAIFAQRAEVTTRQSRLRTVQAELLERMAARENELKEARHKKDTVNDEVHQLEIRLNTLESEIRSLGERVRDEFDVDLAATEPVAPDDKLSEDDARAHLSEQKEALKQFGPVNLLALQEYQSASERERFLKEQLADLTNAKTDLQTTITKINQTAKTLFSETFDKVRGNFKNLFVDLFNGGEADIFLVDPDDPLESDIEIMARPGRKKLVSISQMSGGERALTAIALLFALYLVKPSPFCILDEIDAPLDDANCRRFLRLIGAFADRTQFIIITHNKITMAAADNLYGVTMEEPGISKLVAVRFADVRRDDATGVVRIDAPRDADAELVVSTSGRREKELPIGDEASTLDPNPRLKSDGSLGDLG